MENLKVTGTENSPDINFDYQSNSFTLSGMCYLEDASTFFKPVLDDFSAYLQGLNDASLTFNFSMTYFNSASARIIFKIFDMLDQAAAKGNQVSIIWRYEEDDDAMEEQGEEFGEDMEHASFELQPIPS